MQATSEKMLFQSENNQYMEQVASQCRGGSSVNSFKKRLDEWSKDVEL